MKIEFIPETLFFTQGRDFWIGGKLKAGESIIGDSSATKNLLTVAEIDILEGIVKNVTQRKNKELNNSVKNKK